MTKLAWGTWLILGTAIGCGPKPTPSAGGNTACQDLSGPVHPYSPPDSRLGVSVSVHEDHIQREIGKRVPTTLATGKGQAIGAAGKVSYTVKRKGFSVRSGEDEISVTTSLFGEVDVCKPIGAMCLRYGSCRPEWAVRVGLPTDWARDPSIRPSTLVEVSKGCVLRPVGYNATPELERITRQQASKVRSQIRQEVRRIERELSFGWERLRRPISLAGGGCVRLEVDEIAYAPIQQEGGLLSTRAEARGRLHGDCSSAVGNSRDDDTAPATSSTSAPKLVQDAQLAPEVDINLTTPWPLPDLEQALSAALESPVQLRVQAEEHQGTEPAKSPKNVLWVGSRAAGCPGWQALEPSLDGDTLRFESAIEGVMLSDKLAKVRLPLPEAARQASSAANEVEQRVVAELRASAPEITPKIDARISRRVDVGPNALHVVVRVSGTLTAELR